MGSFGSITLILIEVSFSLRERSLQVQLLISAKNRDILLQLKPVTLLTIKPVTSKRNFVERIDFRTEL